MSDLDQVRETLRVIEACLDGGEWDALTRLEDPGYAAEPVTADADSLIHVLGEVQRLQERVEVAMGAIREELGSYPQMRRAAQAYAATPHTA